MWFRGSAPGGRHRRIAILHIPKTAGTSLRRIAERNCQKRWIYTFYPPDNITPPPAVLCQSGLLIGHYSFGYETRFFADCDRAVFLRDPDSRILSQLSYDTRYFSADRNEKFQRFLSTAENPVDFIEFSKFWYYDNAIVRMLSGVGDQLPFGAVTSAHLEAAVCNLERFDFVGFQESFGADASALMDRYGWRGRIARDNVSEKKLPRSDEALGLIARYNCYDRKLYRLARVAREQSALATRD